MTAMGTHNGSGEVGSGSAGRHGSVAEALSDILVDARAAVVAHLPVGPALSRPRQEIPGVSWLAK